jgi:hypothetical protein
MSDVYQAVVQSFGVIGLKPRSASAIIEHWKAKGIEASDANGFLSASQGSTQFNIAELLQATLKQNPEFFVGHAGEVRYKSDVPQDAKVAYITAHGYEAWAALPVNENSPTAKNVVKPTVISTQLTRAQCSIAFQSQLQSSTYARLSNELSAPAAVAARASVSRRFALSLEVSQYKCSGLRQFRNLQISGVR